MFGAISRRIILNARVLVLVFNELWTPIDNIETQNSILWFIIHMNFANYMNQKRIVILSNGEQKW